MTISPPSLDFGVSSSPFSRPLVLANEGNATLKVTKVTISGDSRAAFAATEVSSLSAGERIDVAVTYRPPAVAGTDTATVTFETDSRVTPQVLVSLLGRSGVVNADAGFDAGADAGFDAGVDAGFDAGSDLDAGFDAGFDAGSDAGFDAGTKDAGVKDAGIDAGPPQHSIFITVTGLLGANLEVSLNGQSTLAPTSDTTLVFSGKVTEGSTYSVVVTHQPEGPAQNCVVVAGTGQQGAAELPPILIRCECPGSWAPLTSMHFEQPWLEGGGNALWVNGSLVVPSARLSDSVQGHFIKPFDGGSIVPLSGGSAMYDCSVVWVPTSKVGFACCTSGGCYTVDVNTAAMTAVSTSGQPSAGYRNVLVPFGESVFVANDATQERAVFNVTSGQWSAVPAPPFDAGCCSAEAWSGSEVLSYGGTGHHRLFGYNPATQQWVEHAEDGGPSYQPTSSGSPYLGVVDGDEYVVVAPDMTGGRYNATAHTWTALPAGSGTISSSRQKLLAADGGVLVLNQIFTDTSAGWLWARNTNQWVALPTANAPRGTSHLVAATPDGLVLWGGTPYAVPSQSMPTGVRYTWQRATNSWANDGVVAPAWVASHGGSSGGSAGMNWLPDSQRFFVLSAGFGDFSGGFFDLATKQWSSYQLPATFSSSNYHAVTAAGSHYVFAFVGKGMTYDLNTQTWSSWPGPLNTALASAYSRGTYEPVLAYTADRLFIWVGDAAYVLNPTTNTYTQASSTNAPPIVPEVLPAAWAVIDAGRVAIWGGFRNTAGTYTYWNTGSIYDMAHDTWELIPPAPGLRNFATAAWTGSELAIVGGMTDVYNTIEKTMLLYNPTAHSWRTVAMPTGYSIQNYPSAVANGAKLYLWKGASAGGKTSGFVFDTSNDTWGCMAAKGSVGPRSRPLSAWTGSQLMIYAGSNDGSDTGGIFTP